MDSKKGHVHLAPRARDLPMVSHVRAKITVQFSSWYWRVFFEKKKDGGSVFCGNSGGVGRTYLLVAPSFKGQPELMAITPSFNGSTTELTFTFTQSLPIFLRDRELIRHKQVQAFLLLFLFFFSSLFTINDFFFKEIEERTWWDFFW